MKQNLPEPGESKEVDSFIEKAVSDMKTWKLPFCDKLKKCKKPTAGRGSRGIFPKKKKRLGRPRRQGPKMPDNILYINAVTNAKLSNINSRDWSYLFTLKLERVLHAAKVVYPKEEDLKTFLDTYKSSKAAWKCQMCTNHRDFFMRQNYIHCVMCSKWNHKACCWPIEENKSWQCRNCRSHLEASSSEDSSDNEDTDGENDWQL